MKTNMCGPGVSAIALALLMCAGCASTKKETPASWSRPRFSPDGTRLTALRNGVDAYEFALPDDLTGRKLELPFSGLSPRIIDLNYSSEGDPLVLCQVTNNLMVWNVSKGTTLARKTLHAPVLGGLLSRDGKHALVYFPCAPGETGVHLSLVDWAPGKDVVTLPGQKGINCMAFSGGGDRVATADFARVIRIWDSDTGELLKELSPEGAGSVAIALDQQGGRVAAACEEATLHELNNSNKTAVLVPNAKPKTATAVGGGSLILLQLALGFLSGGQSGPIGWDANWFKTPHALRVALSDDGQRLAVLNAAPNFIGEFQLRVAEPLDGRLEIVCGLSSGFMPWGLGRDPQTLRAYELAADRTPGQPVFSPDGNQVAIAGNGVRVFQLKSAPDVTKLWLSKGPLPSSVSQTGPRNTTQYFYHIEPVCASNSVSWLARATRSQVCVEKSVGAFENKGWIVPISLGMKEEFVPDEPLNTIVNRSLRNIWQDCGHRLVDWDAGFNLSSTISKWQLDCRHSFIKGWDLTATIEIELKLSDKTGTVLHSARYSGQDHQTQLMQPSKKFIAKRAQSALEACFYEIKNDSKWVEVLGGERQASR